MLYKVYKDKGPSLSCLSSWSMLKTARIKQELGLDFGAYSIWNWTCLKPKKSSSVITS